MSESHRILHSQGLAPNFIIESPGAAHRDGTAIVLDGPVKITPRKPPIAWADTTTLRRSYLEEVLNMAAMRFKAATGDRLIWPFLAETIIHSIEWLSLVDVTVVKHPRVKGCTTVIHGHNVEKYLRALLAFNAAQSGKQRKKAEAKVAKARDTLLATIEAA